MLSAGIAKNKVNVGKSSAERRMGSTWFLVRIILLGLEGVGWRYVLVLSCRFDRASINDGRALQHK